MTSFIIEFEPELGKVYNDTGVTATLVGSCNTCCRMDILQQMTEMILTY